MLRMYVAASPTPLLQKTCHLHNYFRQAQHLKMFIKHRQRVMVEWSAPFALNFVDRMSAAKVSTRSTPSDMPPKQRSQRGSAKAPASKSSAEKGGEKQEGGAPGEGGDGGSATDKISDYAIMILVAIQNACIAIQKFLYNLYLVIKFCWEKPDVAWDLISTTFHLIKVSRDAGLWSWSQLWDMIYAQTLAPMINSQKAEEEQKAK